MNVESFSIGSKYYSNEDRLVVQDMGAFGVVAVLSDGMGGLSLGGVAAEVVTESVADFITNNSFWVGVYPGMTDEMIDYMAKAIIFGLRKNKIIQ